MPRTVSSSKRRPTQVDVARLAGVSQAMVSYVLNDNSNIVIPDVTRRRVLAAIEDLGYVPNRAARSLRTQRTNMVACVVPDIANPFHTSFAKGVRRVAEEHQHDVVLYYTDRQPTKEHQFLDLLLEGLADGVVVTPLHLDAADLLPLLERGIPVVVQGSNDMPTEVGGLALDSVHVDDVAAAHTAVSFLLENGHRRVGMLAGEQDTAPQRLRERGYGQALRDHGLEVDPALVVSGEFREEGGYHGTQTLLALSKPPTAIFAASDMMAVGSILATRDAGLSVPADIAIVGFDDIPVARLIHPPLTTIAQFEDAIGRRAAQMLFERLADPDLPGRREQMPFELIIRGSAIQGEPVGAQ